MRIVDGDRFKSGKPGAGRAPPAHLKLERLISFDRPELDAVLRAYGRGVAAGEWRDYAIDHLRDRAVFSIFRHAGEAALFRIEKHPALARAQGAWMIRGMDGRVLRRGRDLALALRAIEPRALRLVGRG